MRVSGDALFLSTPEFLSSVLSRLPSVVRLPTTDLGLTNPSSHRCASASLRENSPASPPFNAFNASSKINCGGVTPGNLPGKQVRRNRICSRAWKTFSSGSPDFPVEKIPFNQSRLELLLETPWLRDSVWKNLRSSLTEALRSQSFSKRWWIPACGNLYSDE